MNLYVSEPCNASYYSVGRTMSVVAQEAFWQGVALSTWLQESQRTQGVSNTNCLTDSEGAKSNMRVQTLSALLQTDAEIVGIRAVCHSGGLEMYAQLSDYTYEACMRIRRAFNLAVERMDVSHSTLYLLEKGQAFPDDQYTEVWQRT